MISCIVPAAGLSKRMGRWKLLLPYEGTPMLFHVIEALLPLEVPIVLVTGYQGEELTEIVRAVYPSVEFAHNSGYKEGMYSSVRTGLAAISPSDDALIIPGDLPLLRYTHIQPLAALWEELSTDSIRPRSNTLFGHPVICSPKVTAYALANQDLRSMHEALEPFHQEFFNSDEHAYYRDADTPEEYRHLNL